MEYVQEKEHKRVLVAMSGGVDSSVAARLLQDAGFDLEGITMNLALRMSGELSECESDVVASAQAVCNEFGLQHTALDLSDMFKKDVVDKFCESYRQGLTPNPCVDCNRYMKFGELHRLRKSVGADFLATGHYVRRKFDESSGRWHLLKGADPVKDQSYFLFHLDEEAIAHTLFPLGEMNKGQVRSIAKRYELDSADKAESQDICFIPKGDHVSFIHTCCESDMRGFESGPIVNISGKTLGEHKGLLGYTVGQRKGIGIAASEPLYVIAKDVEENRLIVGTRSEAQIGGLVVRADEISPAVIAELPIRADVKTHYRQIAQPASISLLNRYEVQVTFDCPQMAAAPGQAAVFYSGDMVLGGGTIIRCIF